jgi:hypothetical protein
VQSIAMAGAAVQQLAISPKSSANSLVAVALGAGGTQLFPFTAALAAPIGTPYTPTIAPTTAASGAALSVAIDPLSNRLLYIGEAAAYPTSTTNSGGLRTFVIGATSVTELATGSPTPSGGTGPHSILPKSTGDFVYVANWAGSSTGNITGFQVTTTATTYSLSLLSSTVATGSQPMSLAEDNLKNFVLAVSFTGNPYFDAYVFDTTTAGKLDSVVTSSTVISTIAVAAQP